jgi:hypothetical protein
MKRGKGEKATPLLPFSPLRLLFFSMKGGWADPASSIQHLAKERALDTF